MSWEHTDQGDGGWKHDSNMSTEAPTWTGDGPATNDDRWNGDSGNNISQHANAPFDVAHDGGCRNCHDPGHFARDCPHPRQENGGGCFNCGEEGHMKSDCPNPRVPREFTGECHICAQPGHRASECPSKAPGVCQICKSDAHSAAECDANRMVLMIEELRIDKKSAEEAWAALVKADKAKDIDDIKTAILAYVQAYPQITINELEQCFRGAEPQMNTFIIAKRQEIAITQTIVNFQGERDQEYVISLQFSNKPRRAKFAEGWPENDEENMERLAKAGFVVDRMVTKCSNCDQLGHNARQCTEDRVEREKPVVTCYNCSGEGHRARDCPEPRKANGKECRNCGETGHISKDCPSKEPEICRNCQQEGHRAKDCDQERVIVCRNCDAHGHAARDCPEEKDMSRVICRNCDEKGHQSRQCPKPTDWSRVECSTCHEKGHSYKRCPNEGTVNQTDGRDDWGNGAAAATTTTNSGRDWQNSSAGNAAGDDSGAGWSAATSTTNGW
ncbi:Hypothetical protein R9X50_00458900 [Acrodontium crateriforme]|uniref:CCHC-type domain-containing protein n=1 Tax=Acrodontium crateriforme TaxID=150365 RepID=A0AAQ3M4J5_9PEZI|nr:Hypothetical protein R9X50_00458900 [Acrodontium crateriforme]